MAGKNYAEYGVLGKPKNDLEEEIAERLSPLLRDEDIERIKKDKLTLGGCLEKCMQNGRRFEVKSGKSGIARISPEQHWKWVSDYFGVRISADISQPAPRAEQVTEPEEQNDDVLSALLDF